MSLPLVLPLLLSASCVHAPSPLLLAPCPLLLAPCCCPHQVLDSSPYKWLHEMLEVFNSGDLHAYDALCTKYASVLNGQPALVEHERRLREKVREGAGRGGLCAPHTCNCRDLSSQ